MELSGRWWWGTGASAVQTEGASPADDWYRWELAGRAPLSGAGNGFADRFADDFLLLRDLGMTDYRTSINWARVVPAEGHVDATAVDYYRAILAAGRAAGLRMWVCLLHSAIPVWFADRGGFGGEDAEAVWLGWVELAADLFSDLVGGWMPINTPTSYTNKGYLAGTFPPGHRDPDETAAVLAALHRCDFEAALLLRSTDSPRCSNEALLPLWSADDTPEAARAVARMDALVWDSWLDLARQDRYADAFNLYGFTYYYGAAVRADGQLLPHPSDQSPGPLGYVPWPDGLVTVLDRLNRELPGRRFVVAELGHGGESGVDDHGRCAYLARALGHVAAAQDAGMLIDGVSLWTGIDNYEWHSGFDVPFGLFTRDREPRRSAEFIRAAIKGR